MIINLWLVSVFPNVASIRSCNLPINFVDIQYGHTKVCILFYRINHHFFSFTVIAASATYSSLNKFALRSYGDFDSCLDIVAHDARDDRTDQVFFTGQYCLIEVELPLPELKSSITYSDRILDFNQTELSGTFSEYYLMIAPFLYSNPLSFALCLPSTCSPQEIQSVANFCKCTICPNILNSFCPLHSSAKISHQYPSLVWLL